MPKASSNVEPLHQPPAPREALADAIGRHTAAIENVNRVTQAQESAEETVYRNADALRAAELALTEAKAGERDYLASVALGEDAGVSVADAEAAVTKAADDHARSRATRDALAERSDRETAEAAKAERALNTAVVGVIMSEAPIGAMLERAQKLQADLIAARLELRWLQKMNCIPPDVETAVRAYLLDVSLPSGTGGNEFGNNWSGATATEPWLAAAADLKANASAKLPTS